MLLHVLMLEHLVKEIRFVHLPIYCHCSFYANFMKQKRKLHFLKLSGLLLGTFLWLANNSNPPNGRTSAPFDSTCGTTQCHGTSNQNGYNASITVDGLPATIQANIVYPLTLTVTPNAGSPVKAGFQLVAVSTSSNANAGDLAAINGEAGTEMLGGREYIDHRGGKIFSGGSTSWSFNWTAPATVPGNDVTFYFITLLANNNGNSGGDFPVSGSVSVPFSGPQPIFATITNTTNLNCFGVNTGSATVEASGGTPPYTYLWSNGQTAATAINLAAGNYTVTVTGSSGSGTATASTTITQPTAVTATVSVAGTLSCINTTVAATVTAGGGTSPYSYLWPDGQTSNPAIFTAAGSYTVTVTDNNNCTKTAVATVTGNTSPPNAAASANGSLSCTNTSTTLSCTGSSTGANIALLWTTTQGNIVSGATSCNPVVNQPGEYVLRVTNSSNGCTSTASVTVVSTIVTPGATATGGTITCNVPTINLQGTSPTPNVNYAWTGPNNFTSNLQNPSVSVGGNYILTVTNPANGCTSSATATVVSNTTPPSAAASSGPVITCTQLSSQVFATTNANNPSYIWSGPNNFNSTLQNPTVNAGGNYTVIITGTNGCTNSATTAITQDIAPPALSTNVGPTITCVQLSSQVFATSGNNVTYAWSGPNNFSSTQQNPTVNAAGAYKVTVTGTNGCTNSATATVLSNQTPPGATATGGTITCINASVTLLGTSAGNQVSYAWNGPGGNSTLQNFTVSTAGPYNLTTTDGVNGCTSSTSATVALNTTEPVASATVSNNLNCLNASVQINGSASSQGANFSYLWTTTNGNIVSGGTTLTPIINAAGVYNLLVTNSENGCTKTTSATVVQTPVLNASIGTSTNVSCNGGNNGTASATVTGGTGTNTYLWSNGSTTASITGLSAGTYLVTVTDSENCTATATATIAQPAILLANASATGETALGANNGTASAAPSGGTPAYTYLWSNTATTASISGLAPGTYTVTITDANACTSVQTVTVNSFNCNLSTAITSTNITCNGANNGSASVTVSGATNPITYLWSNGATTASISSLAPGVYTVQILDANGCPATVNTTLTEPPVLATNATATNETAAGANNGSATAAPNGGIAPYTYLWSNTANTATISNLAPGSYTVTVTDDLGCTAVQTVAVSAFNCVISANITAAQVSCNGGADGQATVTLTGGTLPFVYIWSNGATTATANNLPAGTYTVTVTDAASCVVIQSVTILQPTAISVSAQIQDVVCLEDLTGSVVIQVNGGSFPYQYTLPGNQGTNLGVGNYAITITDANGCNTLFNFQIKATDNVPPTITCPNNITLCGADIVNYPLPVVTDNCNLTNAEAFLVSGQASGTPFDDGVTTQVYRATDALGNTATCSFSVTISGLPDVGFITVVNDVNNSGVGSIDVTPVAGIAPFIFTWTQNGVFFANTEDISGLTTGVYVLTMVDASGCSVILTPINLTSTTASSEPDLFAGLQFIPNPVTASFRLKMPNLDLVAADLYDTQGQFVQTLLPSDLQTQVDVSALATGLYYLRLVNADGKTAVLKFVKQD